MDSADQVLWIAITFTFDRDCFRMWMHLRCGEDASAFAKIMAATSFWTYAGPDINKKDVPTFNTFPNVLMSTPMLEILGLSHTSRWNNPCSLLSPMFACGMRLTDHFNFTFALQCLPETLRRRKDQKKQDGV
ncbi:MAG TPA: hypothetical protein VMG82_38095 [Candidatus Sulfotelmatobacter sp.]|nr:hypothetical protein [Candidatus Sulfotelmatobacter sp.]